MLKWLKRIKYVGLVILGFAIIIGVLIFLKCSCDGDAQIARDGWKVADKEQTSTLFDRLNPLKKTPTEADTRLHGWAPGTRIIKVEPQEETVYIAIPPTGDIQIPEHVTGVTVYEKPTRDWGAEFRPFLGVGVAAPNIAPAAVAGVDIFHVGRIHTGPAVVVTPKSVAGAWAVSCTIVRNVDARVAGGYGTGGVVGAVVITVAIE